MPALVHQGMESQKQIAKRQSGIRRIERSLRKCDELETQRLASIAKQHLAKTAYQKEVAYRATGNMLNKFRDTFSVEKKEDLKKRPSDKSFQIRLYTKVNRDYWDYEDLREWYNKTGQKPGHGAVSEAGKPQLDAVSAAFCVDRQAFCHTLRSPSPNPNLAERTADAVFAGRPDQTDSSSLNNTRSNYMLQCGGPHDPGESFPGALCSHPTLRCTSRANDHSPVLGYACESAGGFLKAMQTVSESRPQLSDAEVMAHAKEETGWWVRRRVDLGFAVSRLEDHGSALWKACVCMCVCFWWV